jgi:beta-phosphoglucomutase-like phosphatase (HAD superfamily)
MHNHISVTYADELVIQPGRMWVRFMDRMICSLRFDGIATDGDGTLYESNEAISETFKEGLRHLKGGIKVSDEEWRQRYAPLIPQGWAWGKTWEEKLRILGSQRVVMRESTVAEIAAFAAEIGSQLVESNKVRVTPIEPVCRMLRRLHAGGEKITLVTGTPTAMAQAFVKRADLHDTIREIRGPEAYLNGKPHPEPFVPFAPHALALEDSVNGIASAVSAGIGTVIGCLHGESSRTKFKTALAELELERPCRLIIISRWDAIRAE